MKSPESDKNFQLIEKAIRYLEHCVSPTTETDTAPSFADLAKTLDISPTHLQRLFTSWAGISPKQFVMCLQKDHARQLIQTGMSTLSTSNEMGFRSTSKLHRLLVQFEAMTPGEIKSQGAGLTFSIGQGESPFGQAFVCLSNKGINSLEFQTENLSYEQWRQGILQLYPKVQLIQSDPVALQVIEQIFHPHQDATASFGLHLRGTPFQLQVWQALMHLPPGHLASYQQLAAFIGKPAACRAVGSAVAKNPIAYLIPCHRVIQATGELGNYRWDSTRKKALHIWEQGLITTRR
ncbi:methylated-DNA--[protein]-cysteine S-methyltransferase [Limnobacter thiooxidans]|uniref:methylated-DNA--[protein]-cysteine S-methyltransferase n=1 Tax=Limnobacter thiooxidans TaxID=131080 RepID=UPI00102DC7D2